MVESVCDLLVGHCSGPRDVTTTATGPWRPLAVGRLTFESDTESLLGGPYPPHRPTAKHKYRDSDRPTDIETLAY